MAGSFNDDYTLTDAPPWGGHGKARLLTYSGTGIGASGIEIIRAGTSAEAAWLPGAPGLGVTLKVTATATDAGDQIWALVEGKYEGLWVPILTTAAVTGAGTVPVVIPAGWWLDGSGGESRWDDSTLAAVPADGLWKTNKMNNQSSTSYLVTNGSNRYWGVGQPVGIIEGIRAAFIIEEDDATPDADFDAEINVYAYG